MPSLDEKLGLDFMPEVLHEWCYGFVSNSVLRHQNAAV